MTAVEIDLVCPNCDITLAPCGCCWNGCIECTEPDPPERPVITATVLERYL